MRSRTLILALTLLAFAAGSGRAERRVEPKAPASAQAGGLRGPETAKVTETPVKTFAPMAPVVRAPAAPTLASPIAQASADVGQCRLACGRSYYFCLAGEGPEDCPPIWGQCLKTCAQTSPAP